MSKIISCCSKDNYILPTIVPFRNMTAIPPLKNDFRNLRDLAESMPPSNGTSCDVQSDNAGIYIQWTNLGLSTQVLQSVLLHCKKIPIAFWIFSPDAHSIRAWDQSMYQDTLSNLTIATECRKRWATRLRISSIFRIISLLPRFKYVCRMEKPWNYWMKINLYQRMDNIFESLARKSHILATTGVVLRII